MSLAISYLGNYDWWTGRPDHGLSRYQVEYAAVVDESLKAAYSFSLGEMYYSLGDYRHAVPFLTPAVAFFSGERIRERSGAAGFPAVVARTWLALTLAECGEMRAARTQADDAVQVAEALDHPWSRVLAGTDAGRLALLLRDVSQAVTQFERAGQVARNFGLSHWRPWFSAGLGLAYAWAGRLDEAFSLFREATEETADSQFFFGHAIRVAWEAEAHLLAGRIDEARSGAARALELAREHKERGHEAWIFRLLGEMAAYPGAFDVAEARARYAEALALATELGMRPLVAHCHLGLGKLFRCTGDHARGEEHLTTARAMYREMDMGFWLEKAETELGGVER